MLTPSKAFKENLSKLLELTGWSQAELGRRLGVAAPAVNRWVNGDVVPGIDTIAEIAMIFGVPIDDLIKGTNLKPSVQHDLNDCLLAITEAFAKAKHWRPEDIEAFRGKYKSDLVSDDITQGVFSLNKRERLEVLALVTRLRARKKKPSAAKKGKGS